MTINPSSVLRALLTTRTRLVLLLAICITATGLLVPSPASAAAPAAAPALAAAALDPDCEIDPGLCTPPPMLNKQLLQDPSSIYHATTEQSAAISRLEAEALTNALADHQLPASEADAMRSWGRQEVLAQLWALMLKAIRTDPGSRSADQVHVVTWLALMMNRKAEELAHNAGWEFLKWAGRVSASAPRPPIAEVLSDLQGFADGTLLPSNYMFGTAASSDSGYCDYVPPAGLEGEYRGNASRPGSIAGMACFPPYLCTNPSGCDTNQPSFESFLKWGEADAAGNWQEDAPGNPKADDDFRMVAKAVSNDLIYANTSTAFGIETGLRIGMGAAIAAAVIPFVVTGFANAAAAAASTAVITAKAALITGGTVEAVGLATSTATAAAAAAVAATTVAIFAVVIVAIAIAVVKGILVATEAAVSGKLRDVLANALSGVQNLQPMLTDQSDLTGLFSLFIRASGPIPRDTCDNDQFVVGGPVVVPCANLTPVPEASLRDMEFKIQRVTSEGQPIGAPTRSDTLTWIDAISAFAGLRDQAFLTHQARLSDHWLVQKTTVPPSDRVPAAVITDEFPTLSMSAMNKWGDIMTGTVSWPRRQPDGSYKFLSATTSSAFEAFPVVIEGPLTSVSPETCEAEGLCSYTDTLQLLQPGPGGATDFQRVEVSIVPALKAGITVTHSANPRVGEPVTLTATETGEDVGPLTYKWYVEPARALFPPCPPPARFCGYDGPFTGAEIDYTWQGSGTWNVASVVTTASGRETVTRTTVRVDSTGPKLALSTFGDSSYLEPWEPDGWIEHAGATDVLTLRIEWGDGTVTESTYYPGQGAICETPPNCPVFTVASDTRLNFTLAHTYAAVGHFEVTASVHDAEGRLDRRLFTRNVDKAQQPIAFARPFEERSLGEAPYETHVDGGGAATPVVVASGTPEVCAVSNQSSSRVDGHARTTFTVSLEGPGTCVLTADQAGDDNHLAAFQGRAFVDVTALAQQIAFAALADRTFGDAPFEVSATGGSSASPVELSSLTSGICTISGLTPGRDEDDRATATASVTLLGAGTCTIEASQDGDVGYTAAEPVRRTFEVAKAEQALDLPAIGDRTFGDDPFTVSATGGASSADVVLSSSTPGVCTLSGSTSSRVDGQARTSATVTLVAVGTCTILAEQGGDGDHLAAEPVSRSFAVQQRLAQALDFPVIAGRTFGDAPFTVVVTGGGSSAPVVLASTTPSVCTVTGATSSRVDGLARTSATVTLVAAGTCSISANQAGDANHLAATAVSRSFDVAKAAQTLSIPVIDPATYGDAPRSVTVTGGRSTAPVVVTSTTTSVCTVSGATSSRVDGLARTSVNVTPVAAGTCTLRATQAADANTTVAAAVTRSFEVQRALQPMTFPAIADRVFGSAPFAVTVTGGPAAGQVVLVSLTENVCTLSGATSTRVGGLARTTATVKILAAGTCGIAAAQAGDANRWPGAAVRLFTVTRAPLTITAVDKTMTWRGSVPAYTVTYAGFVNGNGSSVVSGLACTARNSAGQVASSTSPAGLYTITCAGATAANYDITYVPGVLRVVYAFTGFTGLSSTNVNSLRAGTTLSLKWVLKDATGAFVSTSSSFTSVKAAPMTCGGALPTGGGTSVGPGVSGLRYASSTGTWTYDWQTPTNLAGTCQALTLQLADGSARTIRLRLTT